MNEEVTTRALDALGRHFLVNHPAQAADVIDALSESAAIELLRAHQPDTVAAVWQHLSPARIDEIVAQLPEAPLKQVLQILDPADLAPSLSRASVEARNRCLALLPRGAAAEARRLMDYPPGSAGYLMDSRVPTLRGEQRASAALELMRSSKPRVWRCLFLVDAEHRLTGTVEIQDLMIADLTDPLNEFAKPPTATASPFDSGEQVADQMRNSHLDALPVIDVHGRLIGAIQYNALLKAIVEEVSVDIQTMVGAGREERALSLPQFAVRKRLPWLLINLANASIAASVVGLFESTIAQFTALAVLMPVVAGEAGNAGAQALAVTMRGLALREISTRHWFRVFFKELKVGSSNGIAIALTTGLAVMAWSRSVGLALVIAIAMVISMVIANTMGAVIPIALTRFGQDPAQSSTILLTAATDIAGFMSFLGIATLLASFL